jgi:hypothetical protein
MCGEGACSRLSAQRSPNIQGRFAPQREQAPSPQDDFASAEHFPQAIPEHAQCQQR